MQKKNIIIGAVAGIILMGGSFYGGMLYGSNKNIKNSQVGQFGNRGGAGFAGSASGVGQRGAGATGHRSSGMQGGAPNGDVMGQLAAGEIISKDDTSATIKTRDGGSKIIFFSDKTLIDKSISGSKSDLTVGQQVVATGKVNSDGSVAAQNIQIRSMQAANPQTAQ